LNPADLALDMSDSVSAKPLFSLEEKFDMELSVSLEV
jgi:hypothetical protein